MSSFLLNLFVCLSVCLSLLYCQFVLVFIWQGQALSGPSHGYFSSADGMIGFALRMIQIELCIYQSKLLLYNISM